jgi:hypothetical protein
MNDTHFRYGVGACLAAYGAILIYLGELIWAILPAVAAVYVLGSLLHEQIFGGK